MAEEKLPVWKEASKDNQHPLHQATWLLFAEKFNAKYADKQLAAKKDEIIEYMYLILDTEELYYNESFGSGYAPAHCATLLGHWQVTDAIPRLMKIIIEDDPDDLAWNNATLAMENMGPAAIEPVLEAYERRNIDPMRASSLLARAGKGDERCYNFIQTTFEKLKDEWDIIFEAENLLSCDEQKAIAYLEKWLKTAKHPKELRERIARYVQDAKDGKFP